MRRAASFVFQNIDGDGVPTQIGDFVGLVEAPRNLSRVWGRLPDHKTYRAQMNYRVAALVKQSGGLEVNRVKSVLVHKAGRRPPTPRRSWLVLDGTLHGVPVRVMVGHAVNSAWAPAWKPTTFREERKRLWYKWFGVGNTLVREGHLHGRLVIVICDGNRARGRWQFFGTVGVWKHGPDEVFVSKQHQSQPRLENRNVGARTGNGRVTHASLRFDISVDTR